MNLDEQLRTTLGEEAGMRTAPPPDIDRLIRGGRVRRRRRTAARLGVLSAAVVLVAGAAYGATQIGRETAGAGPTGGVASQPPAPSASAPVSSALQNGENVDVAPGTYRMSAGTDASGDPVAADVTVAGTGWTSGDNPTVVMGGHAAGLGIYRPQAVADGSGCDGDWRGPAAAGTSQGLAAQLAALPQSTLIQTPTPTTAFGHNAVHLSVRIGNLCPAGQVYELVRGTLGGRGVTYTEPPTAVVVDLWVVDLDGTPVVVDAWHDVDASQALVAQVTQARDSITFVTAE